MSKVYEFITDHTGKIAVVVLFIVVLYLKSLFVTIEDYEENEKLQDDEIELLQGNVTDLINKLDLLDHHIIDYENKIVDVSERQEKKVKIQNQIREELDVVENKQIGIKKDIDYLMSGERLRMKKYYEGK